MKGCLWAFSKKELVLHDKQGNIIAIYPEESEEYQRVEPVLEILFEADKKILAKLLEKQEQRQQKIESQVEKCDKKVIRKAVQRSQKRYNLSQAAQLLGVHRQTMYYWIYKGWVSPKRDYRRYPVFTVLDIESMIEWKNVMKSSAVSKNEK